MAIPYTGDNQRRNLRSIALKGIFAAILSVIMILPAGAETDFFSFAGPGKIDGISFGNDDIMAYNLDTGTWSKYFDGSDPLLTVLGNVDAFHIDLTNDTILLSFNIPKIIPGLGLVDSSDIVRYVASSLGEHTEGRFELFLDGSDVGFNLLSENIDAIAFAPDGRLVVSTSGSFCVNGGICGKDEDLIVFNEKTLGRKTRGSWEHYFDGSDVKLRDSSEDIWGAFIDEPGNEIYLTTQGKFKVPGARGNSADIFICTPASLGRNTSCSFRKYFDGSSAGIGKTLRIDGLFVDFTGPVALTANTSGTIDICAPVDSQQCTKAKAVD